jgi:DNA polymerase III delta prime subunit
MKILVMGLPGAGKTTLAEALARELQCVHFNADEIRREINKDLGFSAKDRLEQARRMGVLCNIVSRYGAHVIADFVCPLPETREAFGAHFIVWVDRIQESRFEDTNKMFVPPASYNYRVSNKFDYAAFHAEEIADLIVGKRRKLKLA